MENIKKTINESILYPEGISERIDPKIEEDLINQKHSLGKHPIFPHGDDINFEEKIIGERFNDVVKRYKRVYDVNKINNGDVVKNLLPLVYETISLEGKHKAILEKLAIDTIRKEYDIDESIVEIHAELTSDKDSEDEIVEVVKPISNEFKNHDEIVSTNEEVYKRRFINALIEGASKKSSGLINSIDEELTEIDPRLPNKYNKIITSSDYMDYIVSNTENRVSGGSVNIEYPTKEQPKTIISVKGLILPALIYELVKGVMQLVSAHGLPKNKKINQFVISKADSPNFEPWDMRIGPALWNRFIASIEPTDLHLKHHIYMNLVELPVKDFNIKMREIMAGTKEGKNIIKNIVENIKSELQKEEFNETLNDRNTFSIDDLFNNKETFNLEELL